RREILEVAWRLAERDGIVVAFRVVRSARRRRTLELTLEPDGVRVAAPLRTPSSEIAEFVRSRIPWVQKHRAKQPLRVERAPLATGDSLPYLGRWLPLEVMPGARKTPRVDLDLLGLRVTVPRSLGTLDAGACREKVEDALRAWFRRRASEELDGRVAYWSRLCGYTPRGVLVRDQRRRWGSCSPDGTLRFNWRLVMLEPRLVDYVVVHEIAHLVRPHHRPSFWAEVERMLPDYRARRVALREAGATLPL
ncbi:MAG: SprT family zinc-dependent metalloprotease, partial [Dehalococcoidia bacterium]